MYESIYPLVISPPTLLINSPTQPPIIEELPNTPPSHGLNPPLTLLSHSTLLHSLVILLSGPRFDPVDNGCTAKPHYKIMVTFLIAATLS